ncbi:MAG: glycine zipper family protein [Thermoanaerobaculia bacterium]
MKRLAVAAVGIAIAASVIIEAQTQSASSGQKTLAATMNVYVFPNAGQNPSQQSTDEGECYNWAVQNTGTDPFQLQKQAQAQQQQAAAAQQQASQAAQGSGMKGAARGAATGALIGGIAGDAGKGAAIGATTGAVAGRSRGRHQQQAAEQQVAQQSAAAQQATAQQLENFKKAFSVCLEAKKYMVKY